MKKGPDKTYRCVASGEIVRNPGGIEECLAGTRKRIRGQISIVDGAFTHIGVVSRRILPAYERAYSEFGIRADLSSKEVGRYVLPKIINPEYVAQTIIDESREKVLRFVRDYEVDEQDSTSIARALRQFFLRRIRIPEYAEKDTSGKGLELRRALGCMNDDLRTVRFYHALLEAMERMEREKESIEIVDAGAGPVPLFGVIAALKSDKARVTCLECNPQSAKMARQIVENLCLGDRVKIICADAKEYRHDKEIDLLISETMFSGLIDEDMVQILDNLSSQTAEDSEIIPEKITVEAGITDRGKGLVNDYVAPLRQVYEYIPGQKSGKIEFSIPLKDIKPDCVYDLVLSSKVYLGGGRILEGNDSEITKPCRVGIGFVPKEEDLSKSLNVSYTPGENEEYVEIDIF